MTTYPREKHYNPLLTSRHLTDSLIYISGRSGILQCAYCSVQISAHREVDVIQMVCGPSSQ